MPFPKKVVVIDTVIKGYNHVTINTGLLQILHDQGAHISLFADQMHAEIITSTLKESVDIYPIEVLSPRGGLRNKLVDWKEKLFIENRFFTSLSDNEVVKESDLLVFTTITPINFFLHAQVLNKIAKYKQVVIGIHGEIEGLFKSQPSMKERLFKFLYKKGFKSSFHIQFLFWSPFVRKNVIQAGLLSAEQSFYAYHPLLEIEEKNSIKALPYQPDNIILSHLGVASSRKNSQMLFKVGEWLTQNDIQGLAIQNIGRVSGDLVKQAKDSKVKILADQNKSISQAQYTSFIQATHFTISFISGEEYVYRISGSILDTVQYYRPIIALKHDFIEDIFLQAGDIGYLCENEEEMLGVLQKIANRDSDIMERYSIQVGNLIAFAQNFYCKNNSKLFGRGILQFETKKGYNQ